MRIWEYVCHEVAPRVSTGYEPEDKNSALPQDKSLEVKFNILSFIMFNYTPGSGHENNFKPRKRYISPRARN